MYYHLGTVGENYIAWHEKGSTEYGTGRAPSLAAVPDARGIVVECYEGYGDLLHTTMLLGTDLVNITYGDAQPGEAVRFSTAKTSFVNNTSGSAVTQKWSISEVYTSTNKYTWNESTLYGTSVTGSVKVFSAGIQSTEEATIDLTVGQSCSISRQFTWTMEQKVDMMERRGSLRYVATIYRRPTIGPFTATFKRGDIEWMASGNVHVSHGVIYSDISIDSP